MTLSCDLTIFEGPDGSGKTTLAKAYAELTGARYVHFGPLPRVMNGLMRTYVEAMLPAVLGYQPVVLDRSWLSEYPYGIAFREGRDRVGQVYMRMLERLAFRCGGVVVLCLPPQNIVIENYKRRKREEYLTSVKQLQCVYNIYDSLIEDTLGEEPVNPHYQNSLPLVQYSYPDYGVIGFKDVVNDVASRIHHNRPERHELAIASAGCMGGATVLVGESFAQHGNMDAWYQWPFASFSKAGCSWWLTHQLIKAQVSERDLYWVNADQTLVHLDTTSHRIIALGDVAADALKRQVQRPFERCHHPEYWSRFRSSEPYPLLSVLTQEE